MPLDKGTSGRNPDRPSTRRRKRREEEREPTGPIRDTPDSGEAVRNRPRQKLEEKRNEDIKRQYGVGGPKKGVNYQGTAASFLADLLNPASTVESMGRSQRTLMHPRDASPGEYAKAAIAFPGAIASLHGPPGRGPKVAPKAAIPEAEDLMGALPEAKRLRAKQEGLYSQERSKRIAEADDLAREIGGREGHEAALKALQGELPKLRFAGGEAALDEAKLTEMFKHINDHPGLRKFERVRTREALIRITNGKVPQPSEIKLLDKAFGPELAADLKDSVGFWRKLYQGGLNVLNVPRALQASVDLSAPFRQGLVLGARHPVMFAREFPTMLKAFKSEGAYENVLDDIASRPTFEAMQKGKLAITDLEGIGTREEQFASGLAETLTGGKKFSPVRMSGRAYTSFLNKFRADAFDHYLKVAADQGIDISDEKFLKSVASWVNHATGRGSIKSLEGAMVPLNAVFFSPRLMASRLQLLNPAYYAKLDPFARKQAVRGAAQLAGAVGLTLWMAKMAGARVGVDPRSSDFGKIRLGDTRIDIAGGFQQYLVAATRIAKGESVSAATGKLVELEGGFAKPSRSDILMRFGRQKLAPVPGLAATWLTGETFEGDPFNARTEAQQLVTPIGIQNTLETYRESGPGPAAAGGALGSIGFGVQTFPDKAVDPGSRDDRGSRYARRSSSGGSRYARRKRGGGSRYAG